MAYCWMLLGCFAFAWMGQFAGMLGRAECPWQLTALARALLAFVFACALARASGAKLVVFRPAVLWWRSLGGSLSLLCTFYAFAHLRTSEVLTLTNTFPIWVAVLSWPLLRQRPTLLVWVAAACGVGGVGLMQVGKLEFTYDKRLAVGLSLVAAVTSAVAMLGLNRLRGLHPWAIVAHFSGVATLAVLAAWLVGGVPDLALLNDSKVVALLLGVGATATAGQLCLTRAFTAGVPARVSVVGLTQIVFAIALELAFGGPWLSETTMLGIALVIAPTAAVMLERAADTG